jgi:transcriptional adapter 3
LVTEPLNATNATNVIFSPGMDHMLPHAVPDASDGDNTDSKPTDQISINTFNAFIKPYFLPFTEADGAFLLERGDSVTPYIVPKLGKHYSEQWAEEDARFVSLASPAPTTSSGAVDHSNANRGQPGRSNDDILNRVAAPFTRLRSRRVAASMREQRTEAEESSFSRQPAGTDTSDTGLAILAASRDTSERLGAEWKIPMLKGDFHHLKERLAREMTHPGLVDPSHGSDDQDTDDTEVTERLRELQHELREQSIINGARKARIAERLQEQLDYQEYIGMLNAIDKQILAAAAKPKKNRKGKKKKSAQTDEGASQPVGVSEEVKGLIAKRKKLDDEVGSSFDEDLLFAPKESIFDRMEALIANERARQQGGDN